MSKFLAVLAALALLCAYTIYNWQILFGDKTPSIAAWVLWSFLVLLNISSYWKMSKDWAMTLLSIASGLACLGTTVVVVAKGGGFGSLDKLGWTILGVGILACLVWYRYKKADYASAIVVVAVAIGFIPIFQGMHAGTVRETSSIPWFVWTTGYALGTVVVLLRWSETKKRNWFELVYPLGCVLLHLPVALLTM